MELSRQSLSELPKGPFTATKLWNDIVSQLKVNLQVKRRRWRMKQYDDAFVASEAVDWLHEYLKDNPNFGPSVHRQQAVQLCQKFLAHKIIEDARGKDFNTVFEDNSHLYRFVNVRYSPYKRENNSLRKSLNTEKPSLSKTQSCDTSSFFGSPKILRRSNQRSSRKMTFPSRTPLGPITNTLGSIGTDPRAVMNGGMKKKLMRMQSDSGVIKNPVTLECQTNRRSLTEQEINEIWWNITITRLVEESASLSALLEVPCSPDDFNGDDYDIEWVRENAEQQGICKASEVVPPWLLSAMKCLVQWPLDSGDTSTSFPKYPGFERDVFRAVVEHFDSFSEPLVDPNILPLFMRTAGVIVRCRTTSLRSLQYCCMLLQPRKRKNLQVLIKLMVKLVQNNNLSLSDELPTKEIVIQTFSRCAFGRNGDMDVIRLLFFMMENFPFCFMQPDGLQFQVEQRVLFLQNCRGKICPVPQQKGTTFCERVSMQEYAEDGLRSSQNALRDLLSQLIADETLSDKERKKKFKQFERSYPDIYYTKFPRDSISTGSRRKSDRLRSIMKPLGVLKHLR